MVFPKTTPGVRYSGRMKNITIIGSGNIGANLARLFATTHHVTVGSRQPAQTRAKLPGVSVTTYAEAAQASDIVILAVPFSQIAPTTAALGSLDGKTVIDVTNPLTPDFMGMTIGHTTSAGEAVQAAFPQARVVKAFNTILAQVLAKAASGAKALPSVLIAGDHAEANAEVIQLARDAGFNAFDTGPLTNARFLEPLAALGIQLAYAKGHGGEVGFTFSPVS